ncbi:Ion transport protein [Phenylobacterium zucineum HLK1]|uniref:Ion transport protein n=1 Tax=Phenylobacterium zucineum (strain HLK1) TaxID=450851 RepID=B4RGJ8_PHEZH|nr:potassium channel family protein [Phenylobacterium zucineum]ACG78904.1 Ion transport protein [Phenylobacterium zucineum HLK1]
MAEPATETGTRRRLPRLRVRLRELYYGRSPRAVRFRLSVIALDFLLIGFFIASPFLREYPAYLFIDYFVALILALDLAARALAYVSLRDWLRRPSVWVDLFVLVTLLFPLWLFNLAFLRVLRLWSLFHSDFFWETVGRRYDDTRWEDVTKAVATLVTFVFVSTGFVYASFAREHPGISGYLDALYFTVTALTTTGFGDITLPGAWGKLLAIIIMISGITLFVRLAQTLIRPYKVRFTCPTCGLMRHDADAVHCKACGTLLNIPNDEV